MSPDAQSSPLPIAVLISGGGTTLVNLLEERSAGRLAIDPRLVIASRPCGGIARSEAAGLRTTTLLPREYPSLEAYSAAVFEQIRTVQARLVVLGGFLSRLIVPSDFDGRVMNIHPALIPAFCGRGMYGHHVHEAVVERGVAVSGCTVHFCDNEYDHGPIILQRTVPVTIDDTPDSVAARVFTAECEAYPYAIRLFADDRLRIEGRRVRILPQRT